MKVGIMKYTGSTNARISRGLALACLTSLSLFTLLLSLAAAACTHEARSVDRASPPSGQSQVNGRDPVPPALLDTNYVSPTGSTISVKGTGDAAARAFQAALDSARSGDVIAIEPGSTITGNFVLPNKPGTGWTVIRSAAGDDRLPPVGKRVRPSDASMMPKLVTPNAEPVIRTAPAAHHYRFVGIEFTVAPGWAKNHGLILLGSGGETSSEAIPNNLIIDRCYIHGNADVDLRRAIALNSASTAVIDSFISDVHEVGADSQAICGWSGPGPFKIVNNYLEGSGENVLFGGADPRIKNLVPSDIEFRRNHCFKPLSWMPQHPSYAGKHWAVKNLFELKNARRVIIDENLFENNWVDGQSGFAILFTVRNQEGTAAWSAVEDVAFTNNIVRHTAGGINFLGRDNNYQSEQVKRVLVSNNLFDDVGGKQWGANGRFLQIVDTRDVTVDHNTIFHTGNIITAYGPANVGFVFTNNLAPHNEYGVIGESSSVGNLSIEKFFPGRVFRKNVIAGGRSSLYPPENFFPPALDDAGFSDRARGNYGLSKSSPYKAAGTDGKQIGCDIDRLKPALNSADQQTAGTPVQSGTGTAMRRSLTQEVG